jgi:cell division protein FtsQ
MYEQEPNTELPSDIRWMRRGTFALLGLGLLALVLFLAWKGAHASVFDWRLLKIEGDVQRNSLATLRANALPRLQGNFMTTPLGEVRAAFEAVPWVRQATVQRVWPRQLLVRLEEHKAIAYWDGRGEFGEPPLERALLNTHSEVFHANLGEVEDEELPQLAGPSGSEGQVLRMWQRLNELARPHQQALTRLQRGLSAGLFMHEGKDVLVTFSAGVTAWQPGEPLDAALERADEALYEAKRTGKNRTCMG